MCRTTLSQLVGLIASEPPSAADADGLRDKRVEVFRAIPPADVTRYVRGQYNGYLSAPGVSPGSQTETFAALRLEIENWRWSGVPFFIRAGKALAARATEVRIIFKPPPRLAFAPHTPHPGEFILRIDPYPGADLMVQAKQPGAESTRTVDLSLTFSEELGMRRSPTSGFWVTPCGGMPCSSSGRTAWSRRGALCNPCWTRRPGGALRPGILGAGRRRGVACRAPGLARPLATFARNALKPSARRHRTTSSCPEGPAAGSMTVRSG